MRELRILLLAIAGVAFFAGALAASENITARLPEVGTKPTHGLKLTLDSDWTQGVGYRPFRISAIPTAAGALPADRTLRVELTLTENYYEDSVTVVDFLELPEGSSGGSIVLLAPNYEFSSCQWKLDVYESGVRLTELCTDAYVNYSQSDDALKGLFISNVMNPAPGAILASGTPEARLFQLLLPQEESDDVTTPGVTAGNPNPPSKPVICPPSDLPKTWLAYTSLDLATIAWPELAQLAHNEPERFEALRRWTHAGGTLLVYDLAGENQGKAGAPPKTSILTPVDPVSNLAQLDREYDSSRAMETRWFGLGRVILIGHALDTHPPAALQVVLRAALADTDYFARQRLGIDTSAGENDYFSFLIPGVGLAPVGAFVALISVFVLVIGPLNYGLLRRYDRLHFFPVTVVAGALLVTGGLFGYALVCDGLGVRVRVRSYTLLDQPSGLAASFSRQAYYAGLAPSDGLSFPNDAAVLPLRLRVSEMQRKRELEWLDGNQQLQKGYFGSRATTQFNVLSSRPSELALRVSRADDGTAPPTVENSLGSAIVALSLCDADGKYFHGEEIAEGESRGLLPSEEKSISLSVSAIIADEALTAPPYDIDNWTSYRSYRSYRRNYGNRPDNTIDTSRSHLERRLSELSSSTCKLAPRTYVAVVESSPTVPLGYARAREEASFHVVEGRW